MSESWRPKSVCVFCGSSNAAAPHHLAAADAFGKVLAESGVRLVYGGGGVGLMGACARAAHAAGGRVLGVIPDFLRQPEIVYEDVEVVVVSSMHERKLTMFQESDAFVVLPGGIGTLEEVIELISWRRLELHRKPIVFYNGAFWRPLFDLFDHLVADRLTPAALLDTWRVAESVEAILPAITALAAESPEPMSPLMASVT